MAKQKSADKDSAPDTPPGPSPGYTVLARRYRPQTFAELVGQEPVARALSNALKGNRVAHAYLFTGARGVGKTSTARILAKALNCVHGPTPEPCGVCEICQSIATGEDVDVLEIDGASNRRIDEVRDIRANVQYKPGRARYKIYIIDEVHMLTKEAFNALLKTLEEPPPHVKFIFATTEVDKVPITILSRCQRFDFAGIALPRVVERLREIVGREGLQADQEALELIARRCGGSMRDAQSLLDQLLAFGGERLTADEVHHLLGTAGDERILSLAEAVVGRDAKKALDLLDEAVVGGLQLGELTDQLIAYWRDLMVVQCGALDGGGAHDLSVPPRHHDTLRRHARALTLDATLAGLDVLSTTKGRLRGTNHGRTLVEMALVRLSRLHDLVSLAQLAQWVGQGLGPARADGRGAAPPTPAPRPAAPGPRLSPPEGVKKNSPSPDPEQSPAQPPPNPPPGGTTDLSDETLPQLWPQILSMIGSMLASEVGKCNFPAISGPNTLVLRFPPAYNRAKEYCQRPDRLARVEEVVRKLTGRPWAVQLETIAHPAAGVGNGSPESSPGAPPDGAGEAVNGAGAAQQRGRRGAKEEAEKLPLIRRALDVLGASIARVDEGFGTAADAGAAAPDRRRESGTGDEEA